MSHPRHLLEAVDAQLALNAVSRQAGDRRGFLGAVGEGEEPAPPSRMRAVRLLQEIQRLRNERLQVRLPVTDEEDPRELNRYEELSRRIGMLADEFGELAGSRGGAWLTPSYPNVPLNIAKLLVLGNSPFQIASMVDDGNNELTKAEAHEWMTAGAPQPVMRWWLARYLPAGGDLPRFRSWRVAKWLKHVNERGGWGALLKERQVHGPAGQVATFRYLDKLDEIQDEDLVRGPRTGVDDVFAHAAERSGAAWTEKALKDHRILNTLPEGWELPDYIRFLNTPAKLAREGLEQEHCVGGYVQSVEAGQDVILAIEVPGKCRSTAELTPKGKVLQHYGAKNTEPDEPCKTIFQQFVATVSPLARLKGYKADGAQLEGADLSGLDLSDEVFRNANLRGANLTRANFHSADLTGADLTGAYATLATFDDANLMAVNLKSAKLNSASLRRTQLQGADLSDAIMEGTHCNKAKLNGASLQRAVLSFADLEGAELHNADLRGAEMDSTIFRAANLHGASFEGEALSKASTFEGATLYEANLSGTWLEEKNFQKADLTGANLSGAHITDSVFLDANMRRANLKGATGAMTKFVSAKLADADLSDVHLVSPDFSRASLYRTNFQYARIERESKFQLADLGEANFKDADVELASMREANLGGANFENARLRDADLHRVNLTKANLRGADLSNANLSGSNLTLADFRGANLYGANMQKVQLDRTNFDGADLSMADITRV